MRCWRVRSRLKAKVGLAQRIRKGRADLLDTPAGSDPGGEGAAGADGRISQLYTDVLTETVPKTGAAISRGSSCAARIGFTRK